MPLKLVGADSLEEDDPGVMNAYLEAVLGHPLPCESTEIVERKRVGMVSHTFSHIQLTLRVHLLTLKASHSRALSPELWQHSNSFSYNVAWRFSAYNCPSFMTVRSEV